MVISILGVSGTTLGLDEKVEAALSYLLFFVTGIVILLLEQKSYFVRFHAAQSTVTFIALYVLYLLAEFFPGERLLRALIAILYVIFWVVGIVKAYSGELYKFPVLGDIAEMLVGRR